MLDAILKNNPAFLGMPKDKLNFISEFAALDKPKNMNQAMPFLMAQMAAARKKNIHFSKPEVQLIAQLLSKDLPPTEQQKVAKMMQLLGQ